MDNKRPSMPNLPSLSLPTTLCQTYFFFSLPDSAITHSINQYELVPSKLLPKAPKSLLIDMGMVRKFLANEPLKDVTNGEGES